jgi:hypothetical protein
MRRIDQVPRPVGALIANHSNELGAALRCIKIPAQAGYAFKSELCTVFLIKISFGAPKSL